jgi:outer membrane receptor protein involved in Fe transport
MCKATTAAALLSVLLASGFAVKPASAQATPTQASQGGIEEVVVTATRREEKLSKVPASISAFTAADLEQLNAKNIGDLVGFTPGVEYNPVNKDISIRGVNSTAGDATTGIYIDDTPIQLRALGFGSDNTLPAVFDLERVEVLRGPQGTLFGAGSEGGTVRYITPAPSLTDYTGYAKSEISGTQYGGPSYELGAAMGGPIENDQLGFRASVWARHDGGWIDKVDYMTGDLLQSNTNYVNTMVARVAFLWQPESNITFTPSVFYQYRQQNNLDQYWVGLSNPGDGVYKTATPENMGDRDNFVLPSLRVVWDLKDTELISNSSYFNRHQLVHDYSGTLYDLSYFQQTVDSGLNADYVTPCTGGLCAEYAKLANPPPLLTPNGIDLPGFGHYEANNYITNTQENFTQEVRIQSTDPDARFVWIGGIFYEYQTQLSVEEIRDPQLPALTQYLWGQSMLDIWGENLLPNGDDYINHTLAHLWQLAGFANGTYKILDDLKLQAGARIAINHFDFINFSDGPQNFGPLYPPGGGESESPFTPMASLSYQITPDDLVYATVSKGYRVGGANPLFPVQACTEIKVEPPKYGSDTVVNYEAGTKDKFFNDTVQISGSVYYLKWTNIQQSITLPSCAFRYIVNQGAAESKGFDLQGEWAVSDNFEVGMTLGYVDAFYTRTSESAGLVLARNGDKLPGSPWTFSVNAQYRQNILGHEAYFTVQDEYHSAETGMTPERDPATTLFDPGLEPEPTTNILTLRVGTTFDKFDASLFVDNLLNSHPQLDLTHQDEFTLLYEASTLRPRTFGLTVTYQY